MHRLSILCAAVAVLLPAGGCVRYPADYSPHYQAVSLGPPATRNGRERFAYVPDACLIAEPTDVKIDQGRLPPGCANAEALHRMVVNKEELVRGSPLGSAPAGPAAEAADRYLNGGDRPAAGGAGPSVKGRGTIQEEPVTSPRTKNAPTDYASSGR